MIRFMSSAALHDAQAATRRCAGQWPGGHAACGARHDTDVEIVGEPVNSRAHVGALTGPAVRWSGLIEQSRRRVATIVDPRVG